MKEPAIVFKDFSFQYKVQHEPTLHDINLTIYKGEKVLILGSSCFCRCRNLSLIHI